MTRSVVCRLILAALPAALCVVAGRVALWR
jgi:hypothetical protein